MNEINPEHSIRLQKILADAGIGSRREIEHWIREKRIKVNGQIATLGMRATHDDAIKIDGKRVSFKSSIIKPRCLAYHKPEGEICSLSDPQDRPSVFDRLPPLSYGRWISLGRLDLNSSGLLIFSTCGQWAHRVIHPSSQIIREYHVRALGTVEDDVFMHWKTKGTVLPDGHILRPLSVTRQSTALYGSNLWYNVKLTAGHHLAVRQLFASVGLQVNRLIRIRFGRMTLPKGLKPGHWIEIRPQDVLS